MLLIEVPPKCRGSAPSREWERRGIVHLLPQSPLALREAEQSSLPHHPFIPCVLSEGFVFE